MLSHKGLTFSLPLCVLKTSETFGSFPLVVGCDVAEWREATGVGSMLSHSYSYQCSNKHDSFFYFGLVTVRWTGDNETALIIWFMIFD